MSIGFEILKAVASEPVSWCLNGKRKSLRRLLWLERTPFPSPLLRAFLGKLRKELDQGGGGLANILLHLGRHSNRAARRKLVRNLIFNWGVKGAGIRARLRTAGDWVPFLVAISPWMNCNLKCTGCYSGLYAKDGELSEAELDSLLAQCRTIGNYFIVITGGEPYLRKKMLLRLFRKYDDLFFLTYTNGTCFDEETVKEIARLGNVAPAISVEGYQHETDARRGAGVHDKLTRAMELLHRHGVMFGISVTYTRENVDIVTTDEFLEHYMNLGAVFAWYFMFMPVGKDPILNLVPTPQQRVQCGQRVALLRKKYPVFAADFWNDGPAVGGCLAGGRRYLHILNSGRVEMCVFAHFEVDNIREKTIIEAANSPFFQAIRNAFPYNESANLRRPCPIIDNPGVLRSLVNEFMVPQGHPHAEDIVRDPRVMSWVDDYAERFKELTEPGWLATIENPASRWYKEKYEYRNLWTFGKSGSIPTPSSVSISDEREDKPTAAGIGAGYSHRDG